MLLRVFDVNGRLVRTLVNEVLDPTTGELKVIWDGTVENGERVSLGVYLCRIDTPGFATARKLVILE